MDFRSCWNIQLPPTSRMLPFKGLTNQTLHLIQIYLLWEKFLHFKFYSDNGITTGSFQYFIMSLLVRIEIQISELANIFDIWTTQRPWMCSIQTKIRIFKLPSMILMTSWAAVIVIKHFVIKHVQYWRTKSVCLNNRISRICMYTK